jgi:hypothetical protein
MYSGFSHKEAPFLLRGSLYELILSQTPISFNPRRRLRSLVAHLPTPLMLVLLYPINTTDTLYTIQF